MIMKELEKMDNKRPFALPETYFADFAANMEALAVDAKPRKLNLRLKWVYAVAASLIGVVFIGQVYITENKKEKIAADNYNSYVLSQVSEGAMLEYYLEAENEK